MEHLELKAFRYFIFFACSAEKLRHVSSLGLYNLFFESMSSETSILSRVKSVSSQQKLLVAYFTPTNLGKPWGYFFSQGHCGIPLLWH